MHEFVCNVLFHSLTLPEKEPMQFLKTLDGSEWLCCLLFP